MVELEGMGGRRFLMCSAVLVAVTALRACDRLSDEAFMWIVLGVVNGYIVGNTTQKLKAPPAGPAVE